MTIQELVTAVQDFIGAGKTDAAFDVLKNNVPTLFPKGMMDLTLLKSRYNQAHDDFSLRGIITKDEYDSRVAQINYALLEFVENIAHPAAAPPETTVVHSNAGKLLHNVPSKMSLGRDTRCTVRIAYDELTVSKDFVTTDDTVIQDVRIAEVMNVQLVDFNDTPCFSIRAITENEQFLESNEYTQWLFLVKAIREGTFPLTIKVAVLEIINGKERSRDIVLEKDILVSAIVEDLPAAKFIDTKLKLQTGGKTARVINSQAAYSGAVKPFPPNAPAPLKIETPAQAQSQSNSRSQRRLFMGIASAVALVLVGVGGFYTLNHLGGSAQAPIMSGETVAKTDQIKPKEIDTIYKVIKEEERPRRDEQLAQNNPQKDKRDGNGAIKKNRNENSDVAINEPPSSTIRRAEKQNIPVQAYKRFPNAATTTAKSGTMSERFMANYSIHFNPKDPKKYKNLLVKVDGEFVTLQKDKEEYVTGFTFSAFKGKKQHEIEFIANGKNCILKDDLLTTEFTILVCDLK